MNKLLARWVVCLVASLLLITANGYLTLPTAADQATSRLLCQEWGVVVRGRCLYADEARRELVLAKQWNRNLHRQFVEVGLDNSSPLCQSGDTHGGMRRFSRFS